MPFCFVGNHVKELNLRGDKAPSLIACYEAPAGWGRVRAAVRQIVVVPIVRKPFQRDDVTTRARVSRIESSRPTH